MIPESSIPLNTLTSPLDLSARIRCKNNQAERFALPDWRRIHNLPPNSRREQFFILR